MWKFMHVLAIGLLVWIGHSSRSNAGIMTTIDLGTPSVSATSASFDVSITFPGGAGDQIEAFQVSVLGSDPLLTGGGTDFTRFVFTPDPVTLPSWFELAPVSASGVGLFIPSDPTGPFLLPSPLPQHVGILTVDLIGIAAGADLMVTLAGGPSGQDTDLGGVVGGSFIPSFAGDITNSVVLAFTDPDGVVFKGPGTQVIPEPGTLCSFAACLLAPMLYRKERKRSFRNGNSLH